MTFKVGDKIKCTGLTDPKYFTNGSIYEILGESGPDMWRVTDDNGKASNGGMGHVWPKRDIHESFELLSSNPVRTVTRREIVPGSFGRNMHVGKPENGTVHVAIGGLGMVPAAPMYTADELEAAALVLQQLAEALRDGS